MRIDPPVSLPSAPRHSPAATAAPEPLDEAPGTWSGFQGLRAVGEGAFHHRAGGELGEGQLAQQHRPGVVQAGDALRVGGRDVVLQNARVGCGADAGRIVEVLDGDGDAVQGTPAGPGGEFRLRPPRLAQGHVRGDRDVGVQGAVQALDALEQPGGHLNGGHLPAPDQLGRARQGGEGRRRRSHCPAPGAASWRRRVAPAGAAARRGDEDRRRLVRQLEDGPQLDDLRPPAVEVVAQQGELVRRQVAQPRQLDGRPEVGAAGALNGRPPAPWRPEPAAPLPSNGRGRPARPLWGRRPRCPG